MSFYFKDENESTVLSTSKDVTRDVLRQNERILQDFINSEVYLYNLKLWQVSWVSKQKPDSKMRGGWFVTEMDLEDVKRYLGKDVFEAIRSTIIKSGGE